METDIKVSIARKPMITSLWSAEEAVPRRSGSTARRTSNRAIADCGKSLKVSATQRLYGCVGLKMVACGNFDVFQYSSEGDPQSLNILCSCSTYKHKQWDLNWISQEVHIIPSLQLVDSINRVTAQRINHIKSTVKYIIQSKYP